MRCLWGVIGLAAACQVEVSSSFPDGASPADGGGTADARTSDGPVTVDDGAPPDASVPIPDGPPAPPDGTPGPDAATFYGEYGYRKPIVVAASGLGEDLAGFPLLVAVTNDADLDNHTAPMGRDLAFYDAGGTELPFELELWDAVNGTLRAWVRVDLSASADTTIYLAFGSSDGRDRQNPDAVWADYRGVWHLSSTSGTEPDSSPYGMDGAVTGAVSTAGLVASGRAFDGASTIDVGDPADDHLDVDTSTSLSYSLWVRFDASTGTWQDLIYKGGTSLGNVGYGFETATDASSVYAQLADADQYESPSSTAVTLGQWLHLAAVLDRSSASLTFYRDGAEVSTISVGDIDVANGEPLRLGSSNGALFLNGALDEVRIRAVALPGAWIAAERANQLDPATFAVLGALQTP